MIGCPVGCFCRRLLWFSGKPGKATKISPMAFEVALDNVVDSGPLLANCEATERMLTTETQIVLGGLSSVVDLSPPILDAGTRTPVFSVLSHPSKGFCGGCVCVCVCLCAFIILTFFPRCYQVRHILQ